MTSFRRLKQPSRLYHGLNRLPRDVLPGWPLRFMAIAIGVARPWDDDERQAAALPR